MNALWGFMLGVSAALTAVFFSLGRFWAGVLAGMPLGIALLVVVVVILLAWAEVDNAWHNEDSGTGDGYRN